MLSLGSLAQDLQLRIRSLGSVASDLWFLSLGSLVQDLWLRIFRLGSLAQELWRRIFSLGYLFQICSLGSLLRIFSVGSLAQGLGSLAQDLQFRISRIHSVSDMSAELCQRLLDLLCMAKLSFTQLRLARHSSILPCSAQLCVWKRSSELWKACPRSILESLKTSQTLRPKNP